MATRKFKSTPAARQPAAEGPDVIYTGSDWDAFSDGCWLGSYVNNQDAWIEARRVYFYKVEDTAVAVADDIAEADAERCPICDHRPGRNDGMPLCPHCTERVYGPLPGQLVTYAYDDTAYDDEMMNEARDIAAELGVKLSPENMRLAIALAGVLFEHGDNWNESTARAWSAAMVSAQRPACRNCKGSHDTQRCPEIAAALFV